MVLFIMAAWFWLAFYLSKILLPAGPVTNETNQSLLKENNQEIIELARYPF